MTEWIKCEDKKPDSPWVHVLTTDGEFITLARWIEKPQEWYSEEELIEIGEEWRDSHWYFVLSQAGFGPYDTKGNEYFCAMNDITHWMPLPHPPDA